MSFDGLDLSAVDAGEQSNNTQVYRKPVLFNVEIDGNIARLKKVGSFDDRVLKLPLNTFKQSFVNVLGKNNQYAKSPSISSAIKIDSPFYIVSFDVDDEERIERGNTGDYLITRESGVNEVCLKNDFKNDFILKDSWNKIICNKSDSDDSLSI
jgi:hypothetical protein